MSKTRKAETETGSLQQAQLQAARNVRAFIEASPNPLIAIDPYGNVTDCNAAAVNLVGCPTAKLIGFPFADLFVDGEAARAFLTEVLKKGTVSDKPLLFSRTDAENVEVHCDAAVHKDIHGRILGILAVARDVTQSQRLVRELQETRNFLNSILQSAVKYSIIGKDLEGRILSWNEGAVRNYGYSADEAIGKDSSILHTPEDARAGVVQRLLSDALQNGMAEGEFERVRKDGSRFMAALVVTPRTDDSGKPIGYLLMSSDISEKRRAEQASQDASVYARSLIEASLDPLVTISPDGKITDVNDATVAATGVAREVLIGTDFSDYFTEPEQARAGYLRVLKHGAVTDYPLTIRHKDGGLMDVLYNASLYKDPRGDVLGVFAAARDVTAQRQSYQYIRSLIEASLDPLVTISPEGKITDVNEATIQATGVSRSRLIGTDFSNYFTEPEKARAGYQEVFERGRVTDYPLTIRNTDGRLTDVLYNASLYKDPRGNVLGVFAAARDVTARREAEAELAMQHKRELERLAELERFQKLTVGRELRMIELKQEIEELKKLIPAGKVPT